MVLARLKLIVQVNTAQPVRPGGGLNVTAKLVGDDGLLYAQNASTQFVTITDPAGTVQQNAVAMSPGFDATTDIATHIYAVPAPGTAVEGTWLVYVTVQRTESAVTETYSASAKCVVSVLRDVPWL